MLQAMFDAYTVLVENISDGGSADAEFLTDVHRSHEGIVHLPPLAEQKRIVERIEELLAAMPE